ncbi:unnamed protein product [Durusdinium trenchii]|uniref:Macro domain-containing protein n=1 Tax=Durusdinium trenchii TaxID=1381693 RepID=A0ABP0RBC0_9DINO
MAVDVQAGTWQVQGSFYRGRRVQSWPHGGFLCLADADLAEWPGEALATSTNRHLEGTLRRNWWGFAGRKSADAALHEKAGPELLAECRAQASSLKFGEVVVTKAPNLKARYVLHTVVPGHPSSKDPRPMPVDRAADYASDVAEAQQLLRQSFRGLVAKAVELNAKSFCCPAIGSGIRGFPASFVAKEGLHLLVPQAEGSIAQEVPYVEVRFWDHHVLNAWTLEACQRKLEECEDHATV